jgi:histidyl-tRNA synthetase
MGSICGGGRYDDLTGIFGLPGVSGVGISFGADRIYDVMLELGLFPEGLGAFTKLLAVNFGQLESDYCLPLLQKLRKHNISCEMYPEPAKMKKQMQYADKNSIPFVLLAGESEMKQGLYSLKNMKTGQQQQLSPDELIKTLTSLM